MSLVHHLVDALAMTGSMTWQIAWSLVFGFTLSAIVQAVVRRQAVTRLLGDDRPATLVRATGLGIASSSCSYAAVALARSLFRKGASFTAAITFELASTNLVIELGIIMTLLLGWQFTLAEFVGGPLVIVLMALLFRFVVRGRLIEAAREQADRGLAGSMEGHAAMDMSVGGDGPFWRRLLSPQGYTSVSHIFVMEWAAVLRDIVIGLVIAGAVAAWVPDTFWQQLFLSDHPVWSALWGPIIGPVVAVLSFVCSIGNVPLAAVLYSSGISFGGVISFMFADLIILPILVIYRKYYGTRMMLTLLGGFYLTMVVAGYVVEAVFALLHLQPDPGRADMVTQGITWNYTTWLDIAAFLLVAALLVRAARTGGLAMLTMMGGGPDEQHDHGCHGDAAADTAREDMLMPRPAWTSSWLAPVLAAVVVVVGVAGGYVWGTSRTSTEPSLAAVATRASATGHDSADVAFAQMMLPHHEQALAMVRLADTRAESPQVKALVHRIAAAQQPEIDTMQGWLGDWGATADTGRMTGMMSDSDMDRLGTEAGAAFDHAFLTMMVGHHDGAITMARDELAHGENADALGLAASILVTQQAQVGQMHDLLGG